MMKRMNFALTKFLESKSYELHDLLKNNREDLREIFIKKLKIETKKLCKSIGIKKQLAFKR